MKKLLVFTDLDGTLLDHQSYDWSAAKPALLRLRGLGFPLIFNSSKTFAELQQLAREFDNSHPMICENGNVAAIPQGYFEQLPQPGGHYESVLFGRDYPAIIAILKQLRNEFGFAFSGFSDLGPQGIAQHTGLDQHSAQRAAERLASEPLLWQQDETALATFRSALEKHGLTLTRGGRFYHVMSPLDKGRTLAWMVRRYQTMEPETQWITVALGDSYNDIQMLEAVDYPVLIRNPHASAPDVAHLNNLISPKSPGPAGWNEAIQQIIDQTL